MATLTMRNLDENLVRHLRLRAAEHGRSAEVEHREILRTTLEGDGEQQRRTARDQAAARLAEFRRRTAGRGSPSSVELLKEARQGRTASLADDTGEGA